MKKSFLLKIMLSFIAGSFYIYSSAQTSCYDTVYYPYYKTSSFTAVSLNASTSGSVFAQYYPAPQPITVSGFEFYGWQSNTSTPTAVVAITCNVYRAGSDSLPSGLPLRSVTVNVDSTFGGGQLAALKRIAIFSSPVTLNTPYVITVETSSSTNVSVISNDYSANNGRAEWLSSVKIGSNWVRSYNVNVGGIAFNADFILLPYVSYTLASDFLFGGCNNGGNPFTFTNKSSAVASSPFYNLYAFYNIHQFTCFMWDYGDTTGTNYSVNGSHTYSNRLNHDVALKDTIVGWRKGCMDKKTKTVFGTPDAPKISNNSPLCSGDSLKFNVDTVPMATYTWSGPKSFSSSQPFPVIPVSDTSHTGNYGLFVTVGGCSSLPSITPVIVNETPQNPIATNDGPKCVGDSVTFSATSGSSGISYHWKGPNGFNSNNPGFSFGNLDSTYKGNYLVFVDNPYCKSQMDTTELYIYPPPAAPVLTAEKGSLCVGDTLHLIGTSVTGALFNWTGPGGFSSSATKPVINGVTLGKAGTYYASVKIGSCTSDMDSVSVNVNALPTTSPVNGSDTSTENYTKTYSVTNTPGSVYYWKVSGGTQISGDSSSSIQVKWGAPGPGLVKVTERNSSDCYGSQVSYPVTISKKPDDPDTTHPTGINQLAAGEVKLYPNPASGVLTIEIKVNQSLPVTFTIADLLGKALIAAPAVTVENQYSRSFDVSQLAKGIYLMKIEAGREEKVIRFIVN